MKGYELKFWLYANSIEEIKEAEDALSSFVEEHRLQGRAVTARKITEALNRWRDNIFIKNQIIKHLES